MKATKMCLLVLLSLLCLTLKAQSSLTLSGLWAVDLDASLKEIKDKPRFERMPEKQKGNVREAFRSRTFHLLNNKEARIDFTVRGAQKKVKGQWAYDPGTSRLTITVGGRSSAYTVVWLSESRIRLVFDSAAPQGLFSSLCLVLKNPGI